MLYLKLRFGMFPLTHKFNPVHNFIRMVRILIFLSFIFLVHETYDYIVAQHIIADRALFVAEKYKDIATKGESKLFVLLSDPVNPAAACTRYMSAMTGKNKKHTNEIND